MSSGFRRAFRIGDAREGLDEELAYHFERTVVELTAAGHTRDQAEAMAARRFGDERAYRRELARIDGAVETRRRWSERLDVTRQSIAHAVRSFARSPGLSFGVIIAFALGIGANLTMYDVVERLLLRPPPHIADAAEVRRVYVSEYVGFIGDRITSPTFSYPDYRQLATTSAFADIAAYAPRTVTVGEGLQAVDHEAVYVTANFFTLLGVEPALGRFFTSSEEVVGGPQQVVLSWNAWQRDHGGNPGAIGSTIDFGYGPYTIIGVTPEGFTGIDLARVDAWLPFHVVRAQTSGTEWVDNRGEQFFNAIARLQPGVTDEAAQEEATVAWINGREGTEWWTEEGNPQVELASVLSARGPDAPPEGTIARLLLLVAAVVLLIAAVNVANLLVARSIRQRRETAVRLALGISRRRLAAQTLLEGMLLAVAGGVTALMLAVWGRMLIGGLLLPDAEWSGGVSGRIVLLASALSVVVGAAAAAIPAFQSVHRGLADTLRQAGAGGVTRRTSRLRVGLALLQTALSVLLLVGAGLFVRSLDRVQNADFGFDPENLVYAIPRATAGAIAAEELHAIRERARETLLRIPGVLSTGVTETMPFYSHRTTRLRVEGRDSLPTVPTGGPYVHSVSPGYLETMGIDVLAGRTIEESDLGGGQHVAVVNRSMAEAYWPGASPIGRCLLVGNGEDGAPQTRCTRVVGIVEDSRRQEVEAVTTFQYYLPIGQLEAPRGGNLMIRVHDESPAMLNAIRTAILALDPRIRYVEAEPFSARMDPRTRSWRVGATVFSVFGLLALLVASIGLYSVLSFDVAQRTREIGVRSALGASAPEQVRAIVLHALRITAVGVTIGLAAALLLAGRVEPLLFEIPPRDPVTFGLVVVVLHMVAALASSIPAWRASRVDPMVVLRSD